MNKRKVCFDKFRTVINKNLLAFATHLFQNKIRNIRNVEKQYAGSQYVDHCICSRILNRFVKVVGYKQNDQTNVDV